MAENIFIPNKFKYVGLINKKRIGLKLVELYRKLCPEMKVLFLSSDDNNNENKIFFDPNTWD
jgi:hypothetical protein